MLIRPHEAQVGGDPFLAHRAMAAKPDGSSPEALAGVREPRSIPWTVMVSLKARKAALAIHEPSGKAVK